MKKWLIISWLAVIFSAISFLFWQNEWKYSLPTPVPTNYHLVKTRTFINTSDWIKTGDNKPLFFHFFNPDCACSRFNIDHFKLLVKEYGEKINFCIVVVSKEQEYSAKDIQEKYALSIPVLFNRSIETACGVYSTPQAVLIDAEHKLYYRGNYNKSRYCTEKNTSYAQMAIDSLLQKQLNPLFPLTAVKSYGCSLPGIAK